MYQGVHVQGVSVWGYTVNVEMFALYIVLRHSRSSNIFENIYSMKIPIIMLHRGNNTPNANLYTCGIASFIEFAKISGLPSVPIFRDNPDF